MKIINNSLEHFFETEKGNLFWWELNPMPLICWMSTLDIISYNFIFVPSTYSRDGMSQAYPKNPQIY